MDQPARGRIDLLGAPGCTGHGQAWGWIPVAGRVAVADAVRAAGVNDVGVKWPNDVVAGAGKLAGILSVRDGAGAIVGIGLNLRFAGARPDPDAVSVAQAGGDPDPDRMLAAVVSESAVGGHGSWRRPVMRTGAACTPLRQCVTLDQEVDVVETDRQWRADCAGIDTQGRLLVRGDAGCMRCPRRM